MSEALGGHVPPVAVVLGAGGAARAVVLALEAAASPRSSSPTAMRNERRGSRRISAAPVRPMRSTRTCCAELPRAGLLVNATSLGWHPGETPIDLARSHLLPAGAVVADLTYRDTDLLLAAQARGLKTVDGLPMLVHQGARAFEIVDRFSSAGGDDARRRPRRACGGEPDSLSGGSRWRERRRANGLNLGHVRRPSG